MLQGNRAIAKQLVKMADIASANGLHFGCVFIKSKEDRSTLKRDMYSSNLGEILLWTVRVYSFCEEYNMPYRIYVDGSCTEQKGNLS